MKLDNRNNALAAARLLLNSTEDKIANALLEAHVEGLEQGRSLLLQGKSSNESLLELTERRDFVLSEIR